MNILGINAFHADSAAAIVIDGRLVAAAEEERFRRLKHWAGFPAAAISYCLREAGTTLQDVDHIAINQSGSANMLRRVGHVARHGLDRALLRERLAVRRRRSGILDLLREAFPDSAFRGRLHKVEHHAAHLSSAFHVSPFEQSAVVSIDGFGDFASAAWGGGRGTDITIDGRIYYPHSLGVFYQAVTQYLGFSQYGDEYKVMGLAAHGDPSFSDAMEKLVTLNDDGAFALGLKYFRHHQKPVGSQWADRRPEFQTLFSPHLEDLLGRRRGPDEPIEDRHRDIACSAQARYEQALFHLLRRVHRNSRVSNLALAGGCAMNSAANGKIREHTGFREIFVQPAAGDAGGAIGAAFTIWHKMGGERRFQMQHAYWGPGFSDAAIAAAVAAWRSSLAAAGCEVAQCDDETDLCRRTAHAIADGAVIGWFQGRMEWGSRALGNRSILCDPRRSGMIDTLNAKIKRREAFRPFAPSVLDDAVEDWFEQGDADQFMMRTARVREEKRHLVPAVIHVDGTCRPQVVSRITNSRFCTLINAFYVLTGVPMLLNTSFNQNEPIVCSPNEALECFLRTGIDVLILGNVIVSRHAQRVQYPQLKCEFA